MADKKSLYASSAIVRVMRDVSPPFDNLMMFLKELDYGEVTIKVKDGEPVMVITGVKEKKLD